MKLAFSVSVLAVMIGAAATTGRAVLTEHRVSVNRSGIGQPASRAGRLLQAAERPEGRALARHDRRRPPWSASTTTSASATSRRTAPASRTCSST